MQTRWTPEQEALQQGWRAWTPEEDAQLCAMVASGMRAVDIAARIGRTTDGVRVRARRRGFIAVANTEARRAGGLMTGAMKAAEREARREEAKRLRREGMSRPQVAEAMGVAISTVNKLLARCDPAFYGCSLAAKGDTSTAVAVQMYCEGAAIADIAERLDRCWSAVQKRLSRVRTPEMDAKRAAALKALKPPKPKPEPKPERLRAAPKPKTQRVMQAGSLDKAGRPLRALEPISVLTAAATFLGRWYRPVFRLDVVGKPDAVARGLPTAYRVGCLTVPVADMLAMARAKGFSA